MIAARQIFLGRGAGGGGPAIVPVEYIKTDGTAWLDTGFVVPNLGCGFEITMACPYDLSKIGWDHVFLGAGSSSTSYTGPMWNFINSGNSSGIYRFLNIGICIGNKRPLNTTESIDVVNALFAGDFVTLYVPNNANGDPYTAPWYINGTAYNTLYSQLNSSGTDALPDVSIAVFGSHVGSGCVNKITADFKLRELKWFAQNDGALIAHYIAARRESEYGLLDKINNAFVEGLDGTVIGGNDIA